MPTVIVAGDLILDNHLIQHRADPAYTSIPAQNPVQSTKGGGAWYLEDIIKMACADIGDLKVRGAQRALEAEIRQRYQVSTSYSLWSLHSRTTDKPKEQVWRIHRFLGYQLPPDGAQPLMIEEDMPDPDILALDDLGGSFRQKAELWPLALQDGGKPKSIILKAHAPLAVGPLWDKLLNDHRDVLTLVTPVEAIRARRSKAISRALSWDRTIEELVREFEDGASAHDLARCRRVVVHFKEAGVAVFTRCPLKVDETSSRCSMGASEPSAQMSEQVRLERFLYHPLELEGTWRSKLPGDNYGASSIMSAAVVRHELRAGDYPLVVAMKRAALAIRISQEIGGGSDRFSADAANVDIRRALHSLDEKDQKVFTTLEPYCTTFPHELLSDSEMRGQPASRSDLLRDLTGAGKEYVAALATDVVVRGWEQPLKLTPKAIYGKYMTVDRDEIERINEVREMIAAYRASAEQRKPLSIAVFGPPGSGKSFAINELAKELFKDKKAIVDQLILKFNLSQIHQIEHLHEKFHQVRTASVLGEIPIVFWDEFDAEDLRWLKYFLSPMQDGEFESSSGRYPLGKAIFIFAGGTRHNFAAFDRSRAELEEVRRPFEDKKGPDFISRLQGFIDIKGPNPVRRKVNGKPENPEQPPVASAAQEDDEDLAHLIRRAVLLRSSLERFQPAAVDEITRKASISPKVVKAILRATEFLHGARSLEAVIKMSTLSDNYLGEEGLPSQALLKLHVSNDFMKLIEQEEVEFSIIEDLARASHEAWYERRKAQGWSYGPKRIDEEKKHHLMLPYKELTERDKELNRRPVRYTYAKMLEVGFQVVRRGAKQSGGGVQSYVSKEEFAAQLPKLAEIEHDIWLREHMLQGYDWADKTDETLLLHPDATSFDKVPLEDKEYDFVIAQGVYDELQRQGYDLVKV
jgi:hypothetical protein